MTFTKLAASTAALLLSSSALMAQSAPAQPYESVFIDVAGTAVLVPLDVALEACALDDATLQTAFQSRIDESGIDQTQFMAQMGSAAGMMGEGAATTDTAAAGTTAPANDMATDDAAATDTAAADASTGMETTAGDTTQTADANATTETGNATTEAGNTTDMATADATQAADPNASTAGTVQNVETTAADTSGTAAAGTSTDPFIALAACQIDQARATELQVDLTRTGSSFGFDAATLGLESGMASQ